MKIEVLRLPHSSDASHEVVDMAEVETVLVRSAYCVKEGLARAFRRQVSFFLLATALVGTYSWVWARESIPLVAVPIVGWAMGLWLAHRAEVREVSAMVDRCLGSIEPSRSSSDEDLDLEVLLEEPSRANRRT